MTERKYTTIKCPTCGAEYLPVELFIPDAFFGSAVDIVRDDKHKIETVIGNKMNTDETYICDYCDVPFKISTRLQFVTKAETKFDFNSNYVTSLSPNTIVLAED